MDCAVTFHQPEHSLTIVHYSEPDASTAPKYDERRPRLAINILIDETFTVYQTNLIRRGFAEWERATSGFVKFNFIGGWHSNHDEVRVNSDQSPTNWGYCSHDVYVMNMDADNDVVSNIEEKMVAERRDGKSISIVGYANLSCVYKFFFIVGERIVTDEQWVAITLHEMGHMLAMGHIDVPNQSAMDPVLTSDTACLTSLDMLQFCNTWNCDFLKTKPCTVP